MSTVAYIAPTDILRPVLVGVEWHASEIPSDSTQSLVVVKWDDNPNLEVGFEGLPGVTPLIQGEALPAEVASLIASLQDPEALTVMGGAAVAIPTGDAPAPDTVSAALRKISWPGARMAR
jgi:hypothetical protein